MSTFTPSEPIPLLLAEAAKWTVVYASLMQGTHTLCKKSPSHGGSSMLTSIWSAFIPFFLHWWQWPFDWLLTGDAIQWYCWSDIWPASGLSWNDPCRQSVEQGTCHVQVGAGAYNSGTARRASPVASLANGTGTLHWWFSLQTLQQLWIPECSKFSQYPVDVKCSYPGWTRGAPYMAQCHH